MWEWLLNPWLWIIGAALVWALHLGYFLHLPKWAERMTRRGDTAGARRLLERIVATPSLLGQGLKISAMYHLAHLELNGDAPDRAALRFRTLCDAITANNGKPPPGLEYDIRSKLAVALERSGRDAEAREQQDLAAKCLENAPPTALSMVSKARMLESQFQYAEACAAYEQALNLPLPWNPEARAETLASLANASFNAGRADETIRRGEEALAENPANLHLREVCHIVTALGYSAQGQADEAEKHRASALSLAVEAGAADRAAQYRAQLAEGKRKQGRIQEAFDDCAALLADPEAGSEARRSALGVQFECLRVWGRFHEALEKLREARDVKTYTGDMERRFEGAAALFAASVEAEDGSGVRARDYLEKASAILNRDPRLGIGCAAVSVWVNALLGRRDEARARASQVEAQRPNPARDREAFLGCVSCLARAAQVLEDWPRARALWDEYLSARPDPIGLPMAYYHRGLCEEHPGNAAKAREFYERAVAANVDTQYARLARARLEETGAATGQA